MVKTWIVAQVSSDGATVNYYKSLCPDGRTPNTSTDKAQAFVFKSPVVALHIAKIIYGAVICQ